jgi:hypothetical protein
MKRFSLFLDEAEDTSLMPPLSHSKKGINDRLITTLGRHQPAHIGHRLVLNKLKSLAEERGADLEVNTSRSQDPKKNPLPFAEKVDHLKRQNPDFAENITDDPKVKSVLDVFRKAYDDGYKNLDVVVGSDRANDIENLLRRYNGPGEGMLYNFEDANVHSIQRNKPPMPLSEAKAKKKTSAKSEKEKKEEKMKKFLMELSASKMRSWAQKGDFEKFLQGSRTHDTYGKGDVGELFNLVRANMQMAEDWDINPRDHILEVREFYKDGRLFEIGDWVESLNTGICGKITRCGTNHVICVTESGIMFKSFIQDVYPI